MENNYFDLLVELRLFTAVVECGGFTAAADKLGLNKPVITRAVQKLETALGVRLLNRTTRRVGVTDEGLALFERCKPGLDQACKALSAAKESRTEAKGLLRMTSPITFGRKFIAPLAIEFRKMYPDIEIELSLNDTVVDLISSGIDIAVRGGLPDDSRLISRPLAPMPLYVCASPAFLARNGVPAKPEELSRFECIRFRFRSRDSDMAWEFSEGGKQFSVQVSGPVSVDEIEIARDAALAGQGFAQLPGYVAVEHIRKGELVPVLLDFLSDSRKFTLTYVNRHEMQPLRDRLFAELVSASLAKTELFLLNESEIKILRKKWGPGQENSIPTLTDTPSITYPG